MNGVRRFVADIFNAADDGAVLLRQGFPARTRLLRFNRGAARTDRTGNADIRSSAVLPVRMRTAAEDGVRRSTLRRPRISLRRRDGCSLRCSGFPQAASCRFRRSQRTARTRERRSVGSAS